MAHRREAEGGPLHPIDQVVDRLGGPVAHVGGVPGGDLTPPPEEGPAERAGLDRVVGVLEVTAELGEPLEGEVGIGVGVELADRFLRLPGGGDVTVRVAGPEQPGQLEDRPPDGDRPPRDVAGAPPIVFE
jgi:hypothetical protein